MALPLLAIEEPTVKMTFSTVILIFRTQEHLRPRAIASLYKELETDMAMRAEDTVDENGLCLVVANYTLIFIERMRRGLNKHHAHQ